MESLQERLTEARETGRLNLSYLGAAVLEDAVCQAAATPGLRVVELDLSSNSLQELPAAVAQLQGLRILRLKYNQLTQLPTGVLAQLPRLAELELDGNQIAAVEEDALLQLPALQRLSLSSNGLAALPESMGRCRMLEVLAASNNPLAQLPDGLGSCPSLTHLDVSSCRLVALPATLGQCRSLQRLFCQNNYLPKVPAAMGHLSGTLKEWNLRANRLPLKYEQARERGLAKFLAFLREEEEIERLQEIERNRPVGIASGPCIVYRCKAVLEDAVSAAAAGEPVEGFAWIRHGYAACLHKNSVYVFGGVVVKEGRKTAELLVLNTDRMEWRVQPTRGDRPCARDGHVMVVDPASRQLVVFGGRRDAGGRRMNDLHFLDLVTWTWFSPKQDGTALPPPREQCAAAFAAGKLLLFGGRTNGARLNDLWVFDTATFRWEQQPVNGAAPSPRQSAAACAHDGQLWIMGGTSNYVLDDCYTFSLETQEWKALIIEGKNKMAARAGGHTLTCLDGMLWMFGGRDALGAHVPTLLKLKSRSASRFEWVETEFAMLANRSRVVLFDDDGRLAIMQCGHPLHKLTVAPALIEQGSVIWDVTQLVPLAAVKEKAVAPGGVAACNPKQERIQHASSSMITEKLPKVFSTLTPRESQLLATAAAFRQRWAAATAAAPTAAGRPPPCLTLLNECGVDKAVCTSLRPASLPHVELHDLQGIAQFVSEFFTCEPLVDPSRPPNHLVSPWSLLEWQAGDSFDLANMACSLLLGAGYNAYVVVGYASKQVATNDQSRTECPWLQEHGLEAPPYAELPAAEVSFEAAEAPEESLRPPRPAAPAEGLPAEGLRAAADEAGGAAPAGQQEAAQAAEPESNGGADAAASKLGTAVTAAAVSPPDAATASMGQAAAPPTADGAPTAAPGASDPSSETPAGAAAAAVAGPAAEEQLPAVPCCPAKPRPKRYVHAFVLIKPGRREVSQALLLNPSTGMQYSMDAAPCNGVECAWNAANFWCNQQCSSSGQEGGNCAGSYGSDSSGGGRGVSGGPAAAPAHGLAELSMMSWSFSNPNCWLPLLQNKEDQEQEVGTVTTELSMHSSKASELLRSRSMARMDRLAGSASSRTFFSPRSQPAAPASGSAGGGGSGGPAAGVAGPAAAVGGLGRGLSLHHLAMGGRNSTPRLGNYTPKRELVDPSMAYLSPDESALHPRPSLLSGLPLAGLPGAAPSWLSTAVPGTAVARAGSSAAAAAAAGGDALPQLPEMPLSWVPPLAISRERLDMRCPRGQKAVMYRQCRRELFARYGECGRWDGLVERLTTFADAECSTPLCVLELFSRRQDRMARRQSRPAQRTTLTAFEAGAGSCLKSVRAVRGAQWEVELAFYAGSRPDGLMRRQHCGSAMEEWFLPGSRPDRLIHRTVQYASAAADEEQHQQHQQQHQQHDHAATHVRASVGSTAGGGGDDGQDRHHSHDRNFSVVASWEPGEQAVAFIREQYSRPADAVGSSAVSSTPGAAVVERAFDLAGRLLRLVMQQSELAGTTAAEGKSGLVTRLYGPDGLLDSCAGATGAGAQSAGSAPPELQRREHAALKAACQAAQAAARAAQDESRGILQARLRQEQSTVLVTPHYDATRVKVEDSDGEPAADEEEGDSYDLMLRHFLPNTGARDMTAAEAEEARSACLSAFDDRMAARHSLLRARLAESGAELARLHAVLTTELQHLSPADQARVQQEQAAAAFRLGVVQRRVDEHLPQAEVKRRELEGRLAADKRLTSALAEGS